MKTRGHALLAEWCEANDVDSAKLARLVRDAAKKLRGVRAPRRPAYTAAVRWLKGLWRPQYDTRLAIEEATDGYVPVTAWEELP